MNKFLAFVFAFSTSIASFAQTALNAADAAKVEKAIETEAAKTTSIQSQFKQQKHIGGMSRDLVSNGELKFKKENKVILNYTTPFAYKMVLNGSKVMMESNGKKNVYNANGGGSSMNEMQAMMSACMSGDLQSLKKKYKLSYFENGGNYLVKITPINNKKTFKEIEMEVRKTDKMLTRLRLTEMAKAGKTENDFTEFQFSNTKQNVALADELFAIE